jgi:hypothetical protein
MTSNNGFYFGDSMLGIGSDQLNSPNNGLCKTGKGTYYDIEGDVSPLTN